MKIIKLKGYKKDTRLVVKVSWSSGPSSRVDSNSGPVIMKKLHVTNTYITLAFIKIDHYK